MERDNSRLNIQKFARIVLVIIIALIVGLAVFTFFKLKIGAKDNLRDAKNVRMALRSADIEMYAAGKTVYNPVKKNGIEDGGKEKAEKIYKGKGTYKITSYDYKAHEITGMVYNNDHYTVTFEKDGDKIKWLVDYKLRVYTYDDNDVNVR